MTWDRVVVLVWMALIVGLVWWCGRDDDWHDPDGLHA